MREGEWSLKNMKGGGMSGREDSSKEEKGGMEGIMPSTPIVLYSHKLADSKNSLSV